MRVNVKSNGHVYGQVSVEEPEDKTAIYHEPFNMNMYSGITPGRKALETSATIKPLDDSTQRHPDYSGKNKGMFFRKEGLRRAAVKKKGRRLKF